MNKMTRNSIAPLLLLLVGVLSCKKDGTGNDIKSAQITRDVAYGMDVMQKMDVYLPAGRIPTKTKVIVLIHPGAWTGGDKTDFDEFVDTIRKRKPDYAIFNLNYRLADNNTNLFPAQENDIKQAIEFLVNKRADYQVSDQFVIMGASAGAHLALLQAYKYIGQLKLKAVVSFFGPIDLTEMFNNPANPFVPVLLQTVTGSTPATNPTIYQQSSPVNFVSAQSPPTLILQGGLDDLVSPSQAILLKNKLQSFNIPYEYVFYANEGHGWFGASLTDSFNKIDSFLAIHLP